jgi:hypothetical protein
MARAADDGRERAAIAEAVAKRGATVFDTEAKAERHIELLRAELAREDPTTETTIEEYA